MLGIGFLLGTAVVFMYSPLKPGDCVSDGGCWDSVDNICRKSETQEEQTKDQNLCWRNETRKSCLAKNKQFEGDTVYAKWDEESNSCMTPRSQ